MSNGNFDRFVIALVGSCLPCFVAAIVRPYLLPLSLSPPLPPSPLSVVGREESFYRFGGPYARGHSGKER